MSTSKFIEERIATEAQLKKALTDNISWIKMSFAANNNLGSSKYRNILGAWSESYPETTGYLVPTLLNAYSILKDPSLLTLAKNQISYFQSLVLSNGSFRQSPNSNEAFVFDTAQIMLGLIALNHTEENEATLKMLKDAYLFLLNALDENGTFMHSNYVANYNPSYYARIVWPMLKCEEILNLSAHPKTIKLYNYILHLKHTNYTFNDCSFDGGAYFYTHNLIYTYRGLWESSIILGDIETQNYIIEAINYITNNVVSEKGKFNGSYNKNWEPFNNYVCSVGNAQLASLQLLIYSTKNDFSTLNNISDVIIPLVKSQRSVFSLNPGAVPSSIPVWGPYQRFKYTNWTQKFFSDALIGLLRLF